MGNKPARVVSRERHIFPMSVSEAGRQYRVSFRNYKPSLVTAQPLMRQPDTRIRSLNLPMSSGDCWQEDKAGYLDLVQNKTQSYMEYPRQTQLWFQPRGGVARVIAQHLPSLKSVISRGPYVFWNVPRPYPDRQTDLNSRSVALGSKRGQNASVAVIPYTIFAECFYWLDSSGTRSRWEGDGTTENGHRRNETAGICATKKGTGNTR